MSHGKSGSGWLVTSLLFFLGWVFMYADRTILSPVQPQDCKCRPGHHQVH